jgi:uncharacterized protein (TIGR00299 family) protein
MSQAIYLESVAGIAGDMFVASFVDAGVVTAEELGALPGLLGLKGVEVAIGKVRRAEIEATHLQVLWDRRFDLFQHGHHDGPSHGPHHHHTEVGREGEPHVAFSPESHVGGHAHYSQVDGLLAQSGLGGPVKDLARGIFRLLAEAEASVHGLPVEDVAFHEIGAVDSILDVVMAAHCVTRLGACKVYASPVRPGRGMARMAHGTYPVPPPASLRLLAGMPVATTPGAVLRMDVELSTPTGIAILKALAPEFVAEIPPGTVLVSGVGAGTMDLGGFPNIFRITRLEEATGPCAPALDAFDRDRVIEIACNIDDDTAEHVAWIAARLMERGALDVWLSPATGKKGRPAVCLSALAGEADWPGLAAWILENGTTFGVRYRAWDRLKLFRRIERRETPNGPLAYKVGTTRDGRVLKEKPEFEELRRVWDGPRGPADQAPHTPATGVPQ